MTDREAFEAWAREHVVFDLHRHPEGNYVKATTHIAWETWQASRDHLRSKIAGMEEEIARAIIAPEVDAHVGQIQGFLYGAHHVIRDCSKPAAEQELSRTIFQIEHDERYELERAKVMARAVIAGILGE